MKYHFKVYSEKSGYWAECVELQGCKTQGDTMAELAQNAKEALDLYLSEPEDSKVIFPLPRRATAKAKFLEIAPDESIVFAMLIRQYRTAKKLSQREMAKKLGKELIIYQRLEKHKSANPTLKTLVEIKRTFPDLDLTPVLR